MLYNLCMNETQEREFVTTSALVASLAQAGHMIDHRLDSALEPYGLSLAKMGVLRNLVEANGSAPLGYLAERLACVKSNITQLVDRLEADGLVRRVPDPEDRRSVRAVITDKGREAYAAGRDAQARTEMDLLRSLSLDDRARLVALLAHLNDGR